MFNVKHREVKYSFGPQVWLNTFNPVSTMAPLAKLVRSK